MSYTRSSANGYQLGLVDTSGTGSTTTWGTTELSFNQPYRVAVTWNFVAGANNDTFGVTVGGNSYLTHAWTSATVEPSLVAAANLRQGATASAPTLTVDNYSVTVVPEPAAIVLACSSLAAMAFLRRR